MDEQNTGETNEMTDKKDILPKRNRRGNGPNGTSNYDNMSMTECIEQKEDHTGSSSKYKPLDKKETGINEKLTDKNNRTSRKDTDDKDGRKQGKGNQDKYTKKSKKRYKEYFWDITMNKRKEESFKTNQLWGKVEVITKIIVCIFISIFVLATAVVSKLCLILITSNLLPPMNDTDAYWWQKTAGSSFSFIDQRTNVQWIWALMLIMSAPYIFTVLGSGWQLLLGKREWETDWKGFWKVVLRETLHSVGLCMMAFILLPSIDPIAGILVCSHVATIPGILRIVQLSKGCTREKVNGTCLLTVLLIFAVLLQLVGIAFACTYYVHETKTERRILQGITICLSPLLISCFWWDNRAARINTNSDADKLANKSETYLNVLGHRNIKFIFLVNLLKLAIAFSAPIFLFVVPCPNISECRDTLFGISMNSAFANEVGKSTLSSTKSFGDCHSYFPLFVAIVGIMCSGACYNAVRIGIKILAQITCVSIPFTISPLIGVAALLWILSRNTDDESCFPSFPLWRTNSAKFGNHIESSYYWMMIASGICGYISLGIISYHIWIPNKSRLRKSEEIFAKPIYCGILTDQSIILNMMQTEAEEKNEDKANGTRKKAPNVISSTNPQIYFCATMWHEPKSEMEKLMQSVRRLDEESSLTNAMYEDTNKRFFNEDVFNFEVHIFFDDAFETKKDDLGRGSSVLNEHVKKLIKVVREVFGRTIKKERNSNTNYGGRLLWELKSGARMYAHLKNKAVIRHKKRWSQVMYMYFLLAYKFLREVHKKKRKANIDDILATIAKDEHLQDRIDNTFIMALDGDVDFTVEAVNYLMDRMRKHPMVGAACGRIHPIGKGAVVWYQKFEYAVSHWLQKVPEDILGCVLCSPGCFSLFRGSALMHPNVMNTYSHIPTKGQHHIKYDQGEDRWLCTLLLLQGYKIEYVAASDAFTKAPEDFSEFFKQRRRWTPSTMANIIYLLLKWKTVVKNNPYINRMYIFYQAFLMFCTILTPGTILLMIVGAITMAFPSLPLWVALLFTILPVAAFIALCFNATEQTQLKYAAIMSILYALLMTIVLVGLVVHMAQNGLCSVTTIFFIYVAVVFVTTAILHPKEFFCVFYGVLYFIAIPSTSLMMTLYALCNLNVISWGTRETTQKEDAHKAIPHTQRVWLRTSRGTGSVLRRFCCSEDRNPELLTDRTDSVENPKLIVTNETTQMRNKSEIKQVTSSTENEMHIHVAKESNGSTIHQDKHQDESSTNSTSNSPYIQQPNPQEESKKPLTWKDDPLLKDTKTKTKTIKASEGDFWMEIIERYLHPFDQTDKDEKEVKDELTNLRNRVCLICILSNALFLCIVLTLQQITAESKILSIPIPCVTGENGPKYVEPISFAFTFIFGIILTIQFLCMLLHRFRTLIHVCSRTEIFKMGKNHEENMRMLKDELCIEEKWEKKPKPIFSWRRLVASVHPTTKSETHRDVIREKWRNISKEVNEHQRRDPTLQWKRVKKCVDKLQEKRSDTEKEMQKIKNEFPNISKIACLAIHNMCDTYVAKKSQTHGRASGKGSGQAKFKRDGNHQKATGVSSSGSTGQ